MEKLPLVDSRDPKVWSTAESTVQPTPARTKIGDTSWLWHVQVDHLAGEPKYPIGWPRLAHSIPAGPRRDWSDWEFLHLWIYVDTPRDALPREPAGLGLHTPDRAGAFNRPLTELRKGEWVELKLPLTQIPRHHDVRQIQFHIAESNYRHGDIVDFYINDLALLRYATPTLLGVAAESAVMFADARQIPIMLQLAGVKPAQHAVVECELRRVGKVFARTGAHAPRGNFRVVLAPGSAALAPGDYEIKARIAGAPAITAKLRLVESPWK